MGFAQGEEKMTKLTIDQIKQKGYLKVSDEIISASRSQLADLFNADKNHKKYKDFYFPIKKIGEKEERFVWSVIFESRKQVKGIHRFNHLLEGGTEIHEILEDNNRFPKEKFRAVFSSEEGNFDSWKFLGVFKFTEDGKPNDYEKLDMPDNCYVNCYKRISDGLILEDWQNEK